jgi:hypothetical protein
MWIARLASTLTDNEKRRNLRTPAAPGAEYTLPKAVLAVSATASRSAGSGLSSQQTGTSWAVRALMQQA